MAVSLVSTGVQFPDATIQTTAAGASPATLVQSTNFSGQTSVTISLDFTTYPSGYTLIWNFQPGNGAFWQAQYSYDGVNFTNYYAGHVVRTDSSSYTYQLNYSGYIAYGGPGYSGSVGYGVTMNIPKPKSGADNGSAIYLQGVFTNSGANPVSFVGSMNVSLSTSQITAVRFNNITYTSGTLRVLGYK